LIRIREVETLFAAVHGIEVGLPHPTVFLKKSPFAVDMVNTGIPDGAVAAPSLMSRRATPPAP
jgi:hypothetical protein